MFSMNFLTHRVFPEIKLDYLQSSAAIAKCLIKYWCDYLNDPGYKITQHFLKSQHIYAFTLYVAEARK